MDKYEIFDEKGAVINTIVADESFVTAHYPDRWRRLDNADASTSRPVMVITDIVADIEHQKNLMVNGVQEVTCPAGTTLIISGELREPGGEVIRLTDHFRMPIRSRDGREKVLLAVMVDGIINISAPLRESGVWSVSEASINESLPGNRRMSFSGIDVFVLDV